MSHIIKPSDSELKEARNAAEGILATCEAMLVKDDDYTLSLDWREEFGSAAFGSDSLRAGFNTEEEWKEKLRFHVAKAYADSYFQEFRDAFFYWEELLRLGMSLVFAEELTGHSPELDDLETVKEEWGSMRERIGDEVGDYEEMRVYGFTAAYYIAEKLLENHDYEELPELTKTDIVEAGDRCFS